MRWLDEVVERVMARQPEGEILIESGGSPSGTYHIGHMRELLICDAVLLELRRRKRQARHIYYVDDLDGFRKVPVNVPESYSEYLGMPLCDIPAPDGSERSYAEYFVQGLQEGAASLGIEVEFVFTHDKYRSGAFVPAIEACLSRVTEARQAIETVGRRKLDPNWTPIQVLENGRLKNRPFLGINTTAKTVRYQTVYGGEGIARYDKGEVKLDWRLDWPGRWSMLHVMVEPFGRDHASAGGSYETGVEIMKTVYEAPAPVPIPYDFINMVGDTKKMSASKGTGLDAVEGSRLLPAEVLRYFVFRAPPRKLLYFDPVNGVTQLIDEFAAFAAKPDWTGDEENLLYLCTRGEARSVVSQVPFSLLVASYQATLKDETRMLEMLARTEYTEVAKQEADIIRNELRYIDRWLTTQAPDEVKFSLREQVDGAQFSPEEQTFLKALSEKVAAAPEDADGSWFHERIYELRDASGLTPKEMFSAIYRATIGKTSGPRAGWFLSILPREWLIERLNLEK